MFCLTLGCGDVLCFGVCAERCLLLFSLPWPCSFMEGDKALEVTRHSDASFPVLCSGHDTPVSTLVSSADHASLLGKPSTIQCVSFQQRALFSAQTQKNVAVMSTEAHELQSGTSYPSTDDRVIHQIL